MKAGERIGSSPPLFSYLPTVQPSVSLALLALYRVGADSISHALTLQSQSMLISLLLLSNREPLRWVRDWFLP